MKTLLNQTIYNKTKLTLIIETLEEFFDYTINNNEVTITGYTGADSQVIIPETIENLPVTTIDIFAFDSNDTLISINTNNVVTIKDFAFANCIALETVIMPNVKTLGDNVFSLSSTLKNVEMPNVDFIGRYCFYYCRSLVIIKMPAATIVSDYAFVQSGIRSIDLPIVKSIGNQSFSYCNWLENINLSKNLTTIGLSVFLQSTMKNISVDYGTDDISNITLDTWNEFVSNLTGLDITNVSGKFVKNNLYISDLENNFTYAKTGDSLTLIEYTGSASNIVLADYVMDKPVAAIANNAFESNSSIISITMPNVITIGDYAFNNCSKLITVIGEKVSSIGSYAFGNCIALENISLPSTTTIYDYAFYYCIKLSTIELLNVTELYDCAFNSCIGLKNINLPKIESISNLVFYQCSKLQDIDLSNVVKIGFYAFESCQSLNKIVISKNAIVGDNNFLDCAINTVIIYYGYEDISDVTIVEWSNFVNYIGLYPDNITGRYVMNLYGIKDLYDITPPVITLLGDNPMTLDVKTPYYEPGAIITDNIDTGLEAVITGTVDISKLGTNHIHYNAADLSGNEAVEVIRVVNIVDTIAPSIILNGDNPMNVEVNSPYTEPGANVIDNYDTNLQPIITGTIDTTTLGEYDVYYNATDSSDNKAEEVIRKVYVNNTIDDYCYIIVNNEVIITCYRGAKSNVIIPETIENLPVTTIDSGAFEDCAYLQSINTSNVKTINESAFKYCQSLLTAIMPKVMTIQDLVFASCNTLNYVNMPNIISIGSQAFANCPSLKSINISKNLASISDYVFGGDPIQNITIDYGTEDISNVTIYNWNEFANKLTGLNLTTVTGKYVRNTIYIKDLVNGLTYSEGNGVLTLINYTGSLDTLVLPAFINAIPVTAISNYVFRDCTSLFNISMPNVISIGNYAFVNCFNLTNVTGNNITTLGVNTFQNCNHIVNLTLPELTIINQRTFENASGLKSIDFPKLTTIKGEAAFSGCINLTTVNLPLLTTLNNYTFSSCILLKDVSIPLVTTIGKGVFQLCTSLKNISLDKITFIDTNAFKLCASLQSIKLPLVETIYSSAFEECISLKNIELKNIKVIGSMAFGKCTQLSTIIISKDATTINYDAFIGCSINSVTIYYGTEDIINVTIDDWNAFVINMGLNPDEIPGKYVMNDYDIKDLSN